MLVPSEHSGTLPPREKRRTRQGSWGMDWLGGHPLWHVPWNQGCRAVPSKLTWKGEYVSCVEKQDAKRSARRVEGQILFAEITGIHFQESASWITHADRGETFFWGGVNFKCGCCGIGL
ncbi:hypothetical protein BDV36DRAFT_124345 [Aspergillus pseudocaelatus]|uniref:Uncharacterized protein n=1 Tax=Aspergillus pseudocaelatus TaxID=1825620 RepID=A0ABQ6WRX4_9EURO|nr:hypothetical protein BDV36DRAFT_124345 [Aspergillus pseudocaelatus]